MDNQNQTPTENQTQTQEPTTTPAANTQATNEGDAKFDYSKLDAILEKRMDGILKNIAKTNGLDDDGTAQFVADYKTAKENKAKDAANKVNEYKTKYDELSSKVKAMELESAESSLFTKLGVSGDKSKKALKKLAEIDSPYKEDGTIDLDKLEKAYNSVLTDYPALKTAETGSKDTGFRAIGPKENASGSPDPTAKLRAAMGLKPKQ